MRSALAVLLLLVGAAARADEPAHEIAALRAEVAELERALADLPSALARLSELDNRVEALRQALARVGGARATDADVRAAVDALQAELGETRRRLAAVETRPAEPAFSAGYDHGVTVRAGTTRLTLNGAIQARIVGEKGEGFVGADSVDLHHGALSLDGEVGRFFAARLAIDFGNGYFVAAPFAVRGGLLRDAWLEVRPFSWLTLRAGQFAVPFGRQRLLRDHQLAAAERNLTTLAFTVDRDLGALVEARLFDERIAVDLSVTDGINAGLPGARNDNIDFRYVGRLALAPLGPVPLVEGDPAAHGPPRVGVAGSVLYDLVPTDDPVNADRNGDGRVDNVEVLSAAAELAVAWWRFSGQAEYFFRRESYGNLAPVARRSFQGVSLQTQAVAVRGYALVEAHFSWAEPHTLGTALAVGATPPSPFGAAPAANASLLDTLAPTTAWNVGGSLVGLYRSHDLKLQATLDWHRRTVTAGQLDALVLQIQATVAF